ncbi:MAG: MMPL family transporter [Zoogloeaceae bacterium]|jgi:predicted exporter|nr:MMPL family transporter [Zoogloeaceae bacterium]
MNPKKTARISPLHRGLACGYGLFLLLAALLLVLQQPNLQARIDTDLLALLPQDERQPAQEAALKALATQGERQLVLLAAAADETTTRQVAAQVRARLLPLGFHQQEDSLAFPGDFYTPYRQGLLTDADYAQLAELNPDDASANANTAAHAKNLAYAAFAPGALPWTEDPFGFFGNWLQTLGEASPARPSGGELMVEHQDRRYAVLIFTLPVSAFDGAFQKRLSAALAALEAEFPPASGVKLLHAGVVLHAAAAARQAEGEMRLIGLGSLAGTLLLIGVVFQSARALKLVILSLLAGSITALSASFLIFPRLHLITLVFGMSLIGVAVDYAILVFAQHLGSAETAPARFKRLFPTLCAALITPMLAYLALMLTPFPGLKQMAVFAAFGILGAWTFVLLAYPYLLPAQIPMPRQAPAIARLLEYWPRWHGTSSVQWVLAVALALFALGGLLRLTANDDIRNLFAGDAHLIQEQTEVFRILHLPSPAQMFLIAAPDAETLLQREEALTSRLRPLMEQGEIAGYAATSRWLPSQARQRAARALQAKLRPARVLLAREMDLPSQWIEDAAHAPLLTPETWLAAPFSQPLRAFWLGQDAQDGQWRSMVLLQGLATAKTAQTLARLETLPGVRWIDKTQAVSRLMQRYRHLLTQTLLAACLITPLLLARFFTRATGQKKILWRVMTPVFLAGLLTLALLGILAIPVQMLTLLALLLTLGMGVDYAIFLQTQSRAPHTLLGTTLAALLTLLSFGLLALSATPALSAFGLTATLGVGFSWLFTPMFRATGNAHTLP